MNKRYMVFAASSPQFHFWCGGKMEEEGVSREDLCRYRDPFSLYGLDYMATEAVFLKGWNDAIPSHERGHIHDFLHRLARGRKDLIMCNTVLEKLEPPALIEKPLAQKRTPTVVERISRIVTRRKKWTLPLEDPEND